MNNTLCQTTVRRHFNRAASRYDQAAVLQREVADRLLSRLDFIKQTPSRILDCGARTGYTTQQLAKRYPDAEIVALELSEHMLALGASRFAHNGPATVCADYDSLPFADNSFDLVFSHFALHWASDWRQMMQAFYRVLRGNGLLMLTTIGPDTLLQWRAVCQELDEKRRQHDSLDMHTIGDCLLQQGLIDSVMDREDLDLHYPDSMALWHDLKATGVTNARVDRNRGLQGKKAWQQLLANYQAMWQQPQGHVVASVEIIYGHAWLSPQKRSRVNDRGEVLIPASMLTRQQGGS